MLSKSGADGLAGHKVATDLQFVKTSVFLKCSKGKQHGLWWARPFGSVSLENLDQYSIPVSSVRPGSECGHRAFQSGSCTGTCVLGAAPPCTPSAPCPRCWVHPTVGAHDPAFCIVAYSVLCLWCLPPQADWLCDVQNGSR